MQAALQGKRTLRLWYLLSNTPAAVFVRSSILGSMPANRTTPP